MKMGSLGTVISGTVNPQDTIPAFADELRRLRGSLPRSLYNRVRSALKPDHARKPEDFDLDTETANDLADALQDFAPPYAYFGSHAGDGADFGFWLHESWQDDFDGLQVDDTSKVPSDYTGEVLHVNDHGNATLYVARKGKMLEIWSVV